MARSTRRLALTSAGTAYLEKCRVILNLVESSRNRCRRGAPDAARQYPHQPAAGFGMKRLAPLLLDFSQRYPEVRLDMDYSDRRVNLIEEGIDLSVRITRRLDGGDVARRIGSSHMHLVASPDYLARHGLPQHPSELAHHECLGYTAGATATAWQFMVDGQLTSFTVRSRINANNGEVLTEAAAQGLGITLQPDFIIDSFLASRPGRAVILA
jgi:DNA-binding transcriptional LysR family regulator